ncbi:M23 family metallopeptidase [Halocynthiibacter namhaensis]|uniref:M23 family metallopeptidase n=1 Tax=Halocynthiibacter namhaensis TaxID=1290553 RepID=UPI0009E025CD|nr:M23 family metallopeptidase [Halocynthiibacter namhaensis]
MLTALTPAPASTAEPRKPEQILTYPDGMTCGKITSFFGDLYDLDGSMRETPHVGIDFGAFGDTVVSPASGSVVATWRGDHSWGEDWNILIQHLPRDLGHPDTGHIWLSEFDHLQRGDMQDLQPGERLELGDTIGKTRHPGNQPRFRAETHFELWEIRADALDDLTWESETTPSGGRRDYWWIDNAQAINPLEQMQMPSGRLQLMPKFPKQQPPPRGMIYPLDCN